MKLLKPSPVAVVAAACLAPWSAYASDYYVAPNGSDAASNTTGSMAQPFATIGRAQTFAGPGDTVYVRGGTYTAAASSSVGVAFSKSGAANAPIRYFAYPGELPVFDWVSLTPNARVTGFDITASWIHIRGMEIKNVQQIVVGDSWSIRIRGSNNIVEAMDVHHGEAPGIFITSGANNLILNCDSHDNYDPLEDGGNADGFGCHSTGGGNVMRGCRAYRNSDDGFDFINAPGTCIVENSWAFSNGYVPGTSTAAGNGAGFKAGGFGLDPNTFPATIPRHVVRQNVAFGNRAQGFYANHHPGGIDFFNNTAFRNGVNYNMLADVGASNHTLRNNIAMSPGTAISNLSGGTDDFNSWSLGLSVSSADFLSVDEAQALASRQADGSLPNLDFMRLSADSDLIDKGTDVGLPYAGSAPDLGAFEAGTTPGGGTGGIGGTGGAAGMGGSGATGGAPGLAGSSGTGITAGTSGMAGSGGMASGGAGNAGTSGTGASGTGGGGGGTPATSGGNAAMVGSGGDALGGGGAQAPSDPGEEGCTCASTGRGGGRPPALLAFFLAGLLLQLGKLRRRLAA